MDLTFGPDDMLGMPSCVNVSATGDDALEEDESLVLTLGSPDEHVLFGPINSTTVSIPNDDGE